MQMLTVNERGYRIGETHHNAVLTNLEVEQLQALRLEGFGYRRLSVIFEISKTQTRRLCAGLQRCQLAVIYRPATGQRGKRSGNTNEADA